MSILSVSQDIAPFIGIKKPTALMASTAAEHLQLAAIANRALDYIVGGQDWQLLSKQHTVTGDGVLTEFAMPSDFDKFTNDARGEARIYTPIVAGPMCRVDTIDDWLRREVKQIGLVTYSWIIFGGKLNIKPALPVGVSAYYFYQSKNAVSDGNVTPAYKSAFNSDGDVFLLDERMLMLCMLWMWRHSKGQSYAQYQEEFEKRKAEVSNKDKGPRSISFGRSYSNASAPIAYPFELV
jgi:hypothetical protein